MKNLEDYIKQNRNFFDSDEPEDLHFDRFSVKLTHRSRFRLRRTYIISAAAAVVFLFLSITALVKYSQKSKSPNMAYESSISNDFTETELYYEKVYEQSLAELNKVSCTASGQQKNMILEDVEELNKSYEELKTELSKNPEDKRLHEALISNYENKINLLNLVINELKQNC